MLKYLGKRLLSTIPVLITVLLVVFAMRLAIPGDAAEVIAGFEASPEAVAKVREDLGLDRPIAEQAVVWVVNLLQGDLGTSILQRKPVAEVFWSRFPVTLSLTLVAMVICVLLGVVAGMIAAVNRDTFLDYAVMIGALAGVSVPNFLLGLVAIFFFSVHLGWLPTGGYTPLSEDPVQWLMHLILPALAMAFSQMGLVARMTRSSMLEVLRLDYIRTARAFGVSNLKIYTVHAFRNALLPIITVIGIIFSLSMGGAIVIEQVFSLPGVGSLVVESVLARDFPVVQGALLITATLYICINILVDITYALVDPRVRYD